jgi:hypothetical protein
VPILREIPVSLAAESVLAAQGRSTAQPGLIAAAERAIALGQTLWSPALVYDEIEVLSVGPDSISLASASLGSSQPLQLTVGPKAHLLAPAQRLLAAVYTIGPALGAKVGELAKEGNLLLSYLLDCVGVMALGAVGERLRRMAEQTAAASGWGVGAALSPGSLVGWSIQGQRELCEVLPIAEIAVGLSKYCILEPHKSASVVIGMGPGFGSHEVGSVCVYCSLRDSCWRRKGGDA